MIAPPCRSTWLSVLATAASQLLCFLFPSALAATGWCPPSGCDQRCFASGCVSEKCVAYGCRKTMWEVETSGKLLPPDPILNRNLYVSGPLLTDVRPDAGWEKIRFTTISSAFECAEAVLYEYRNGNLWEWCSPRFFIAGTEKEDTFYCAINCVGSPTLVPRSGDPKEEVGFDLHEIADARADATACLPPTVSVCQPTDFTAASG